ncbi:hypothetical protein K7Y63_003798 [Serratia marcescens]
MIIRQADVIESIHTGNTFVVEYVSEDGHFFILHPKDGEKSRGYNIHELNRSFVKVPYVSLSNEGDMIQQQIEPQNIPDIIPDSCEWTYDDQDYKWDSGCGDAWMFADGGPTENGVKFCQGCGKPVLLAAAPEGGNG